LTEPREVCSHGEKRVATRFDVLPLFVERWSPRSFLDSPPSSDQLRSMFEAARLAPSAHNTQPPRFIVTERGRGSGYERLFACLSDGNRLWAHTAPVLILATALRERYSPATAEMVPYPHSMHDLGLAVMSLLLQGQALGLACHPMAGFDPDQAREAFAVPMLFEPGVVIAVGYLGPPDALPTELRAREVGPRTRRNLEELVFEDTWGRAARLLHEPTP
jgi:nitroreductase